MQYVFVVDQQRRPLAPCHPARARRLLRAGKAAVLRRAPFTIALKRPVDAPAPAILRLKLDPGSKVTGLALLDEAINKVLWAAELAHRGDQISLALRQRAQVRRSRRQRNTRYRPARFANRRRQAGWIAPSLRHRVETIMTWVSRLRRWCPVGALSVELARFDLQALEQPEISGVEYQQGTLKGYEIREYLLEKWQRQCAYCGIRGQPLEVEHIVPKIRHGSNRVSNLTLACHACNQRKGAQTAEEFGFPHVQHHARRPLRDAAAVNITRWALYNRLVATGLPVEAGSGGRTKYQRIRLGLPKAHWLDAASVGALTPESLRVAGVTPLLIRATGHGNRQLCGTNASGVPIRHRQRVSRYFGFRTGDMGEALVLKGKRSGRHVGRVACRATGYFDILTDRGKQAGVHYRWCRMLQRQDGYLYFHRQPAAAA